MIFIESGFGNTKEAFLERRYRDGLNVIYSNENNKGKTLVIQGLMYSIGNDPIFPSGFEYRDYYFYSKIQHEGKNWAFLRKNNSFLVRSEAEQFMFDSVSELKRFISGNLLQIPTYLKDGNAKIADLALLFQIFFLPQDNRDTSSVIGGGYFNKQDFYEMLYAFGGETARGTLSEEQTTSITQEIRDLEEELLNQQKFLKFAKRNPRISEIANKNTDKQVYEETKKRIEVINGRISDNKKRRSRESSYKVKLENLILELNSLNKDLNAGRVACGDCGSTKVIFKNNEFAFDVSNNYVRSTVLSSIRNEISLKSEIIEEITREVNHDQDLLACELEVLPKDVQTIMFRHEEILSDVQIGNKIRGIFEKLENKRNQIAEAKTATKSIKSNNKDLSSKILDIMRSVYLEMDPEGRLEFAELFSKRGVVYSGSEGQEFYFAKLFAIKSVLNHPFPIVIDSFRDGELSSQKEAYALQKLQVIEGQKIITSTVKTQEYAEDIYQKNPKINAIDYSLNRTSRILDPGFVHEFTEILNMFGVTE